MAQIIKHRRGSLEGLASVTASINKGELVIATGSSNFSVSNGTSLVFAAAADGQVQAVNRILIGSTAPNNFSNTTYNGLVNGVPYYDSTSGSLYILGSNTNTKLDLLGNINSFSQSVDSRLDVIEISLGGGGSLGSRVAGLEALTSSYNSTTASLNAFTSSTNVILARIEESTASLNLYTASADNKFTAIGASTSSLNTFSSSTLTRLNRIEESTASLNSYTASLKTAITVAGSDVTINGNLTVAGTTTAVNSTTIQLGDNIIELNGTGAANGGLVVKDPTAPNTVSGSLLWDSTNDYWKAGQLGSEYKILLANGDNVISGSSQVILSSTTGFTGFQSQLQAATSSLNTFTASAATRLNRIEESTASLNLFSASVLGHIADINTKTGSFESKFTTIQSVTASYNTATASLNLFTSSINSFTASENTRLTRIEESTASLNLFSASVLGHITDINLKTGSFQNKFTTIQSVTQSYNSVTASLNSYTSSTNTRLTRIEESTASLNLFSSSTNSRLNTLEGIGSIQGVGTGNSVTFDSVNTTNNLTVGGDLVVLGNTVTLNVAELVVEDKLINLASGSTSAIQSDGAGIAVNGASASFTYAATPNAWTTNIPISSSAVTASLNVPGFGSSKRIAFRETTGNLDFVTAPTTPGDLLQWNGTAFTMSNVIDGGTY